MKSLCPLLMLPCCALLIAGNVAAQVRQTTDGAHRFLQEEARDAGAAGMQPFFGIAGIVTSTGPRTSGQSGPVIATIYSIDNINESGNADPCVTRITKVAEDSSKWTWIAAGVRWRYDAEIHRLSVPFSSFPAPRYFHWGKVSVKREKTSNDGGTNVRDMLTASYLPSPGAKTELFGFLYDDSSKADRVEYAMRFLQASCDTTAATGF